MPVRLLPGELWFVSSAANCYLSMKPKVTDEVFATIVTECLSVAQVLARLGLVPAGGNYKTVHNRVRKLGLDTSHFTGAAWNRRERYQILRPAASLSNLLVRGSVCQSFKLKNRLLEAGLLGRRCSACQLTEWCQQPIPLELDHINGVNNDNRIENLRLLCPNCHALTATYRGKNKVVAK